MGYHQLAYWERYLIARHKSSGESLRAIGKTLGRSASTISPELRRNADGSDGRFRGSQLSVWWLRLGVLPEFSQPGKPQQNGLHERMHKTLKDEATKSPGGQQPGPAAQVQRVPPGVQRGANARSAGHEHAAQMGRPIADRLRCATSAATAGSAGTSSG